MSLTANSISFTEADQNSPVVQILNRHRVGKRGMFIVHMDRMSVVDKRRAFVQLLLINILLAVVFIWRLVAGKGKYLPFLLSGNMGLMDRPSSSTGLTDFAWTMVHTAFDSILAIQGKIILIPFATGPFLTRIRFGFRAAEPTFRVPTQSVAVERLAKLMPEERILEMQSQTLKAVDKQYIRTHPVDFTNDGIWVVDYAPGRDAREMLAKKEITEEYLALSVWKLDDEMKWKV